MTDSSQEISPLRRSDRSSVFPRSSPVRKTILASLKFPGIDSDHEEDDDSVSSSSVMTFELAAKGSGRLVTEHRCRIFSRLSKATRDEPSIVTQKTEDLTESCSDYESDDELEAQHHAFTDNSETEDSSSICSMVERRRLLPTLSMQRRAIIKKRQARKQADASLVTTVNVQDRRRQFDLSLTLTLKGPFIV